tara:strand:+ start:644 stop:1039 length:396 start_codon:yes stop_codon:yes gene_type:complete
MKYNLNEIFSQAIDDNYSVRIDGNGYKSVVLYSVKIIKDNKTDEVIIIDTVNKLYYYQMISKEDEEVFLTSGWKNGVYNLTSKKYVKKLDLIEKGIQESIKNKSPKKAIDYLKSERDRVINKYTKINNKIK